MGEGRGVAGGWGEAACARAAPFFPFARHAPSVIQLPRLVLVKVVDQLLNVQREAKVLLDDFYEAVALHKAAQVGLPAAGDKCVDCGAAEGCAGA